MNQARTLTITCAGLLVGFAVFVHPSLAIGRQTASPVVTDSNSRNSAPSRSKSSDEATSVLVEPPIQFQLGGPKQRVDNKPLDPAQVRKAIRDGVQYLKSKQKADGTWQKYYMPGDKTALCTLALLNAGESPNDPKIKAAIEQLRNVPTSGTYFVSLRIMVLATADPKGKLYRLDVDKDVKWLLRMQVSDGPAAGGWSYGQRARSGGADGSNTQFALLALHEASRIGVKVPEANWQLAKKYWASSFSSRGGFTYNVGQGPVSGSMTCAGIASWIIIHENLADIGQRVNGQFANCCFEDEDMDKVKASFNWLAKHFTVKVNPKGFNGSHQQRLYYLYGLERAGRLSGKRFIGPHDWYRDGAKQLIAWQNKLTGYWVTPKGHGEDSPEIGTALALLFLAKGKRPVAVGKYNHGADHWDTHPAGVHYLTRQLEKEWELKLNWQTVKAEGSSVDDLLEAPVLFMSGKDFIGLTAEQKKRLLLYLENGGFLFAEACQGDGCGDDGIFDKAFHALMAELFPESRLEALDRAHPIWNFPIVPRLVPERPLLGLQACCRTSVVYCPRNLSCYWALNQPSIMDSKEVGPQLKQRIKYCTDLGVSVVAYATGRQLNDKGETPKVAGNNNNVDPTRALVFPKLLHEGGADDAPNAWRNVLRRVEQLGLEMKIEKKMISPTQAELANHPFIFLHGRNKFSFTKEQRQAIRDHLDYGGFIFADSICASQAFTESFRREMQTILGTPLSPIDPGHEIWSNQRFGYLIDRVTLRTKDPTAQGGFREEQKPPHLEGAMIKGRLAVVFSPVDLSCALENTKHSQCTGYTREDAIKIGTNVVLYSLLSDANSAAEGTR